MLADDPFQRDTQGNAIDAPQPFENGGVLVPVCHTYVAFRAVYSNTTATYIATSILFKKIATPSCSSDTVEWRTAFQNLSTLPQPPC